MTPFLGTNQVLVFYIEKTRFSLFYTAKEGSFLTLIYQLVSKFVVEHSIWEMTWLWWSRMKGKVAGDLPA